MKLQTTIREVVFSPYYRRRPVAVAQLAYAKWLFARHRATNPNEIWRALNLPEADAVRGFERWEQDLKAVVAAVRETGHHGGASFEDGLVLFGIVRATSPRYIIETGVAAGVTTSFICAALIENGIGELISIELPPEVCAATEHADGASFDWPQRGVGWAIPEDIRRLIAPRHTLVLDDVRIALPKLLNKLQHIDLFIHDDLHTPDHMLWEYELVWPRLTAGGVLVSDDVNYGWIEFVRRHSLSEHAFVNIQRLAAVRK